MAQIIKINPTTVLEMLSQGKTREEIREELGLTKRDLRLLFSHPELKGKKTIAKPAFVFVDGEGNETNPLIYQSNAEEEEEDEIIDNEADIQNIESTEENINAQGVEESVFETTEEVAQVPGPTEEVIAEWDNV